MLFKHQDCIARVAHSQAEARAQNDAVAKLLIRGKQASGAPRHFDIPTPRNGAGKGKGVRDGNGYAKIGERWKRGGFNALG